MSIDLLEHLNYRNRGWSNDSRNRRVMKKKAEWDENAERGGRRRAADCRSRRRNSSANPAAYTYNETLAKENRYIGLRRTTISIINRLQWYQSLPLHLSRHLSKQAVEDNKGSIDTVWSLCLLRWNVRRLSRRRSDNWQDNARAKGTGFLIK